MIPVKSHYFNLLLIVLCISLPSLNSNCFGQTSNAEYLKYKKEGDKNFELGSYQDAMRNYALCLVEDGHENDKYAGDQMTICKKSIKLLEEANEALGENNIDKAIIKWKEVENLNKSDKNIKALLGENLEKKGSQQFAAKDYEKAKASFTEAMKYSTTRQAAISLKIKECDLKLNEKEVVVPKPVAAPTVTKTEENKTQNPVPIQKTETKPKPPTNQDLEKFANEIKKANTYYENNKFRNANYYYESAAEIAKKCTECLKYNNQLSKQLENTSHNISVIEFKKWRNVNKSLIGLAVIGAGLFSNYYLGYVKAYNNVFDSQAVADPDGDKTVLLSLTSTNNKAYIEYQTAYNKLIDVSAGKNIYNSFLGAGATFGTIYLVRKIIGKERPDNLDIIPFKNGLSISYNF